MPGDGETALVVAVTARAPADIADEIIRRLGLAGQQPG
jgi:hypothetical protein